MLKTFLSNRARKSASYINKSLMDDLKCDKTMYAPASGEIINLVKGRTCIDSTGFFILGGKNIKISYLKDDGTITAPVNNAFGGSSESKYTNTFILETETAQDVFYGLAYTFTDIFPPNDKFEEKHYAILKKDFTVTLSLNGTFDSGSITEGSWLNAYFFAPSGAKISVKNHENSVAVLNLFEIDETTDTTGGHLTVFPKAFYSGHVIGNENGPYFAKAEITVKGNESSYEYPNKIIELKTGAIYSESTESVQFNENDVNNIKGDESKPEDNSLGGGAIAGIIIACVVVVAVAVFCVYWFIFREKSDSSAPEA